MLALHDEVHFLLQAHVKRKVWDYEGWADYSWRKIGQCCLMLFSEKLFTLNATNNIAYLSIVLQRKVGCRATKRLVSMGAVVPSCNFSKLWLSHMVASCVSIFSNVTHMLFKAQLCIYKAYVEVFLLMSPAISTETQCFGYYAHYKERSNDSCREYDFPRAVDFVLAKYPVLGTSKQTSFEQGTWTLSATLKANKAAWSSGCKNVMEYRNIVS